MAAAERKRTIIVALLANLVIALSKFAVAAISGSAAMAKRIFVEAQALE